ncbi:hypothetical protein JCM6882_004562 [Rhodosporidiobolus microsporus]
MNSAQEGPALPAFPAKDTHPTAHPDKDGNYPAAPSQWVEPHTRGTSDHMEYGISPGLQGGTFPAPGVEDEAAEEWTEQLSKSNPSCEPGSSFFPSSDPLDASAAKPTVLERASGMMEEVEGWMKGDDELREEGRMRRKFGGKGEKED